MIDLESQPLNEITKRFFYRLFRQWGISIIEEKTVFSRERRIDLVVTCKIKDHDILKNTVFSHFRQFNIFELKGKKDPLSLKDYNRIVMRAWAFPDSYVEKQNKIKKTLLLPLLTDNEAVLFPDKRTLTIVCITRPDKILDRLQNTLKFKRTARAGVYHNNDSFEKWIICPSELALVPENYPLLVLAKGKKLEQFFNLCMEQNATEYIQLILDVGQLKNSVDIIKKVFQVEKMKLRIEGEAIPIFDKFVSVTPNVLELLPSLKTTFKDYLDSERRKMAQRDLEKKQRLEKQALEEKKRLEQQVLKEKRQLEQQHLKNTQKIARQSLKKGESILFKNMLSKLFVSLPDWVDQRIEQATEVEINTWANNLFTAKTVQAVFK